MGQSTGKSPKVFISYNWTSSEYKAKVRELADRLIKKHNIDVIIDSYELRVGDDTNTFMESMADPETTRVLVLSDRAYTEKANSRKAGSGVGAEAQIISSEVYKKVRQDKFMPIVCERNEDGEAYLPVFMKTRVFIDFSSAEAIKHNWKQFIKAIHGKPLYEKPSHKKAPIETPLTNVTDEIATLEPHTVTTNFNIFKRALLDGENAIAISRYRRDFLDSCFEYADQLRVRVEPETDDQNKLGEKLVEDCRKLKSVRTLVTEWILLEGKLPSDDFRYSLTDFLEQLPELKHRPDELRSWRKNWFDAHVIFVYELFLYIIAALLKTRSYSVLHEVLTHRYLPTDTRSSRGDNEETFRCFYGHSELLQSTLLSSDGRKYDSATAEFIKRHAGVKEIPFSSIIEAELVILLMSYLNPRISSYMSYLNPRISSYWYPQTLSYAPDYNRRSAFQLFVRAEQHKDFLNLAIITGINDVNELRKKVQANYEQLNNFSYVDTDCLDYMGIKKWDTLK